MVERSFVRRPFSLSSRSKFLKRDREGVASTVGTLMALLVFLTLITMFTNTYIPIWMKENEKSHMDEVLTQFSDMKSKVDILIVNAQVTQRPTIDMYQPIAMGSDAIPIFASATAGYMSLKPAGTYDTGVNITFNYEYLTTVRSVSEEGGGAGDRQHRPDPDRLGGGGRACAQAKDGRSQQGGKGFHGVSSGFF